MLVPRQSPFQTKARQGAYLAICLLTAFSCRLILPCWRLVRRPPLRLAMFRSSLRIARSSAWILAAFLTPIWPDRNLFRTRRFWLFNRWLTCTRRGCVSCHRVRAIPMDGPPIRKAATEAIMIILPTLLLMYSVLLNNRFALFQSLSFWTNDARAVHIVYSRGHSQNVF